MSFKTTSIQVFLNNQSVLSKLPVDEIKINVNGGYTRWNRLKQSAYGNGSFSIGVDLCRSATLERNQTTNRSLMRGTLIFTLGGGIF